MESGLLSAFSASMVLLRSPEECRSRTPVLERPAAESGKFEVVVAFGRPKLGQAHENSNEGKTEEGLRHWPWSTQLDASRKTFEAVS